MTTENQPDNGNQPTPEQLEATAAAAAKAAELAALPNPPLKVEVKPDAAAQAVAEELARKEADKNKPTVPEAVVYNVTGDVGLDMTLKFVGDLGYGPEHPAMAAAIEGDFSLLEAELAAKGVKGYDAYIKLGQKAYADISTKTKERQAKDKAAVEGIAGGAAEWAAMTAWAAKEGDESEKAELKAALGKGGLSAQMAATWLATQYNKVAGKPDTEGAGKTVSETKGGAGASSSALSPREYGLAVAEARQAHKGASGDFETSAAYRSLQQRRSAYRG
jgi:hypothetical protein